MPLNLPKPILYLITSGATSRTTTSASDEFTRILSLVAAAVAAKINLLQIREKNLTDKTLYDLSVRANEIAHGSATRLLINDRADIARASGADGVHLTARSIPANIIRRTFGAEFLIGVSTHSSEEVERAYDGGADFAVFGPLFETDSKRVYGKPQGLVELSKITARSEGFPILALGGINLDNAAVCIEAGATGIAGISLFQEPKTLVYVVQSLRKALVDS